ncbi:Protein transport protein YOS1 [Bifiguratus adelaidae]|uniref:Protein transport protein YOS1 n=1 Tax=Bifiguratus adelaidae TaxID=1938954 RepID=A0A261XXD0_9FUNG|nr:Protein transport protein YOS1 [Bifiguratus adelaidae]
MALLLGQLIYVMLLFINAIAVLSEDRFLARVGWGHAEPGFGDQGQSVKSKIVNLISAVRTLLRIPLIGINIVIVIYELILG